MLISAPRGTADILPENSFKWAYVEQTARTIADVFGYDEIRTPIFEHTELFIRGIGTSTDIVRKEMYVFEDKKGRSLCLRPEGTATVMRSLLEHKLYSKGLNKLFYIGPFFRYERPQAGRFRQFHQFGLEALGVEDPAIDAEIIHATCRFFRSLGLESLKISLNSLGCGECRALYRKALVDFLSSKKEELCGDCNERLSLNPLRVLDCKNKQCSEIVLTSPVMIDFLCGKCEIHFETLKKYLSSFSIPYTINSRIVRGLDYYTGTVFEVVSDLLGAQDALCGGGRYDLLSTEIGERSIPAVGVAMGIERTISIMEKYGCSFGKKKSPKVYIVTFDENSNELAASILNDFREHMIPIDRDYMARSIKTQMKEAALREAEYVFVIGSDEVKSGVIKVKRMSDSEQYDVPLSELINFINK